MAEFVEQRMEEMLGEVEQMERVNLLESNEVKELIKKRKHFEYKIQKKTKQKEDFLAYIQYETNLLSLLAIRRENIGYQPKKAEIEGGIKTRINKLFKIMEHRFQSDVTIWLSHIQFLKDAHWEASVSRIYLRMLQVHNDKPGLWVAAAKWEFENLKNADNGRQIMLRGLRFLPQSWTMHREYLKLELLYVEQLRKRSEVLKGEKEDNEEESTEEDLVTDCAIVKLVAKAAVEAVGTPEFVVSLIATLRIFPFASDVEDELVDWLKETHPTHAVTVDTLARRELGVGSVTMKERVARCVHQYKEGLHQTKDGHLLDLAFTSFKELMELAPKLSYRVMAAMLDLLEFGRTHRLLTQEHYKFWLSCLDYDEVPSKVEEIVEAAVQHHPDSPSLWIERLAVAARSGQEKAVFSLALTSLQDESSLVRVWEVMLRLVDPVSGWKLVQENLTNTNKPGLRLLYLEQAGHRGIATAREVYQGYRVVPPFSQSLHYTMVRLEQEEPTPSLPHIREVLDTLCHQFGSEDPLPWIAMVKLEMEAKRPLEAAKIICKAETMLSTKELVGKFAILREKEGL